MAKLSQEVYNQMVELRKRGATYPEIMQTLGVSKWQCIHYLKDVKVDKHFAQREWEKAQAEGKEVLRNMGFEHIVDLNKICPSPYWDYYAESSGQPWLIDVTVDLKKDVVGKVRYSVKGYNHAILLKQSDGSWKMVRLNIEEEFVR